jgi:hypothetical protein
MVGVGRGVGLGVGNTLTELERVMTGTVLVTPAMLLLLQLTKIDDNFSADREQSKVSLNEMSKTKKRR